MPLVRTLLPTRAKGWHVTRHRGFSPAACVKPWRTSSAGARLLAHFPRFVRGDGARQVQHPGFRHCPFCFASVRFKVICARENGRARL
jgi:hypothetical protein